MRSRLEDREQVVEIRVESTGVIPVAASIVAARRRDCAQDVWVVGENLIGPDAHERTVFGMEIAKDPVLTAAVCGATEPVVREWCGDVRAGDMREAPPCLDVSLRDPDNDKN